MKHVYLLTTLLTLVLFGTKSNAQVSAPAPIIYGASPFQDSLWGIDTTNWSVTIRYAPSLAGFTITGINGLATDPCSLETYAILKVSGVSGRVLATIDLSNGTCTQIGNLGDNFASLAFDKTGQLYGQTGDGASVPETFYSIDKLTGNKTLLTALGNGADGEIICYNYASDQMYHWSGNGTTVYEKFMYVSPYTVTGISGSLNSGGETFGAMYLGPNKFLISNISSNFKMVDTLGNVGPSLISLPDDLRGLAMEPAFSISEDTICLNDTVYVASSGIVVHNMYFNWGDGTIDTLAPNTMASHLYTTTGNHTLNVTLDNGTCSTVAYSIVIKVNALPVVSINGNHTLCPGASTTLNGSSGGASQWYLDGNPISGATTNTYTTSSAGIYNMTKTNTNGCSDSSHVSFVVSDVPNPIVNLGSDTTVCGSVVLDAQNPTATYSWNTLETTQTISVTTTGTYSVTVIDTNNCSNADTVDITIKPIPSVNLGSDTTACGSVTLDAQNPQGTFVWSTLETTETISVVATGSYWVTVTDTNSCSNSDTIDVTINALPTVTYTQNPSTFCVYNQAFTLSGGSPAGGTYSGPNVTSNQFDPQAAGIGTYVLTYSYTDVNGCSGSDTAQILVDVCDGLAESSLSLPFKVYPNPSNGIFNVVLTSDAQKSHAVLRDISGKTLFEMDLNTSSNTIDISALSNGYYLLQVNLEGKSYSVKVLKN